jgi:hypothetical protein
MIFNSGVYTASYFYSDPTTSDLNLRDSVQDITNNFNDLSLLLDQFIVLDSNINNKNNIVALESGSLKLIFAYREAVDKEKISNIVELKQPIYDTYKNTDYNNGYSSTLLVSDTTIIDDISLNNNEKIVILKNKPLEEIMSVNVSPTQLTGLKKFDIEVETVILNTTNTIYINVPSGGGNTGGGGPYVPPVPPPQRYKYTFIITDPDGNTFSGVYTGIDKSGIPSGADIISTVKI